MAPVLHHLWMVYVDLKVIAIVIDNVTIIFDVSADDSSSSSVVGDVC